MELAGKRILFLGDSITEGHGTTSPEALFWRVLERRTGARCLGIGIGGTRIAPNRAPSAIARHDMYFGSRVAALPEEADIVAVFGGTNDFGHGDAPLGTPESRGDGSFCAALHQLFTDLIDKYPSALIFAMTPLHRLSENSMLNDRGLRQPCALSGYVDAILQIAGFYGIPVLDLFRVSGIQPAVPALREKYMPDGLHPNDAGHLRIAERLQGFLSSL